MEGDRQQYKFGPHQYHFHIEKLNTTTAKGLVKKGELQHIFPILCISCARPHISSAQASFSFENARQYQKIRVDLYEAVGS